MTPARQRAVERGHEPVKALELNMLNNVSSFIKVRLAGYAYCYPDMMASSRETTAIDNDGS
jgi:hypothetical protein